MRNEIEGELETTAIQRHFHSIETKKARPQGLQQCAERDWVCIGRYQCIALFFHWQYPQFMFIDREAFIMDYQKRSLNGQFCSSALVNAVCSIGALMSTDPSIKEGASEYSKAALDEIMSHGLSKEHEHVRGKRATVLHRML